MPEGGQGDPGPLISRRNQVRQRDFTVSEDH
jgi:hypothetical protein